MKIALIILGVLGVALTLWGLLGLNVYYDPPEDPPLPQDMLDTFFWNALREMFLGVSALIVAIVFWRREKAKARVMGGLDGS